MRATSNGSRQSSSAVPVKENICISIRIYKLDYAEMDYSTAKFVTVLNYFSFLVVDFEQT